MRASYQTKEASGGNLVPSFSPLPELGEKIMMVKVAGDSYDEEDDARKL